VRDPHLPIVLITAYGSIDMARAAFKSGAMDLHHKPWSNDELLAQVAQAVESRKLPGRKRTTEARVEAAFQFSKHHWQKRKKCRPAGFVAQVAGVALNSANQRRERHGKELIAKAIHSASPRADKAFVPVNTGSIRWICLESQLFGHVKGASRARWRRKRIVRSADQGTIFFDEIATISPKRRRSCCA